MDWQYNVATKQWELTRDGWRGILARWASSFEWTAAIEPIGNPAARRIAPHIFTWAADAQDWCEIEIASLILAGD